MRRLVEERLGECAQIETRPADDQRRGSRRARLIDPHPCGLRPERRRISRRRPADAVGKLATLPLRTLVASIVSTESQHMSVVLGDLGRPQVPQPFVTGPPPQPDTS